MIEDNNKCAKFTCIVSSFKELFFGLKLINSPIEDGWERSFLFQVCRKCDLAVSVFRVGLIFLSIKGLNQRA